MTLRLAIGVIAAWIGLFATSAVAQNSGIDGEYAGDGLKLIVAPDGANDGFRGTIEMGGQSFTYQARLENGALRGSFAADKHSFPFVVTPRGDEFVFDTEGTTYVLRKAVPKAKNPLARDGAAQAPPPPPSAPKNPLGADGEKADARTDAAQSPPNNAGLQPPAGGAIGGIGIRIDNANPEKKWAIVALLTGGPAEQAGVKAGEVIVAVDGKRVDGMTMEQIGALLRGPVGSTVRLATVMQFPGGGSAESEREIERAALGGGGGAAQAAGAGDVYRHRSGLWTINAPGGDWKMEEAPDGNTTKWMHASGALIFVTVAPNVPFRDADAFYQQSLLPAWKQGGVEVGNESRYDAAGAPGTIVQFRRRNQNGAFELGQTSLFVVNGTGVIFQLTMPEAAGNQLNDTFNAVANSFRITSR